jgi:hypothetical protein
MDRSQRSNDLDNLLRQSLEEDFFKGLVQEIDKFKKEFMKDEVVFKHIYFDTNGDSDDEGGTRFYISDIRLYDAGSEWYDFEDEDVLHNIVRPEFFDANGEPVDKIKYIDDWYSDIFYGWGNFIRQNNLDDKSWDLDELRRTYNVE